MKDNKNRDKQTSISLGENICHIYKRQIINTLNKELI